MHAALQACCMRLRGLAVKLLVLAHVALMRAQLLTNDSSLHTLSLNASVQARIVEAAYNAR